METGLLDWTAPIRAIGDAAPFVVWGTNSQGHCFYLNRTWTELTGRLAADGVGWGWLLSIHPNDREMAKHALLRATHDQRALSLECRLQRRDGTFQWVRTSGSPVMQDHKFGGIVGSIAPIIMPTTRRRSVELTKRELQVLGLIASGQTSKDIAAVLQISGRTVEVHTEHIIHKMNSINRVQAVVEAIKLGLVKLDL